MRTLLLLLAPALFAADFRPLFNGRNLDGWQHVGPGSFAVEDGMLKTVGGMGLLFYEKEKIGNATVRVVFKTSADKDNSGVVIRMPEAAPDAWYGVHNGYEVQIDGGGDDWHSTGAIYSISKVTKRMQKPTGEWNTMEIVLEGQRTTIRLNGEVVNVYQEGQEIPARKQWYEPVRGPRAETGHIGLQNHDGRSVVWFREISVSK
jgi:hypothetical protein